MLITSLIDNNTIGVKFNYFQEYIDRIKTIPGIKFDDISKLWIFPKENYIFFEEEFYGEILYKTPKWILEETEKPNFSKMYKIPKEIKCPELKFKPYDYQKFGIRFMINKLNTEKFVFNADDVGLPWEKLFKL